MTGIIGIQPPVCYNLSPLKNTLYHTRYSMFRFGRKQESPSQPPQANGPATGGPTHEQVMAALQTVPEPELGKDIVTLNMVENVVIQNDKVTFTYVLTTPACPLRDKIRDDTTAALMKVPGV